MRQVSVIVAAYNSAGSIDRAVKSALAQPETLEVILVDDASTDSTVEVAKFAAQGDGRLRTSVLPANRGPAAARNVALDLATGTFVGILDADDWMQEGRLGRLLAIVGEDWDFAADDLLLLDADANAAPRPMLSLSSPPGYLSFADFLRSNLPRASRHRRELGYLKPLIRRTFLERHGLRYAENLRLGEDFVLYATALALGARFVLAAACGYVAMQRAGSLSHTHSATELLALAQADEHLLDVVGSDYEARRLVRLHRRLTLDKYCHRVALDAKRRGDWLCVARAFTGTRSAALHILRETVEARTKRV
jgi:succinoglycan biosynthesis protein ExoU